MARSAVQSCWGARGEALGAVTHCCAVPTPLPWACVLAVAFILTAWAGTAEARRVALLVGNDAYDVGRLSYPAQDIEVMRKALIAAGFAAGDIVAERNADQRRLRRAIQDFGRRAHGADVALFYFSGHGAQVLGQN